MSQNQQFDAIVVGAGFGGVYEWKYEYYPGYVYYYKYEQLPHYYGSETDTFSVWPVPAGVFVCAYSVGT